MIACWSNFAMFIPMLALANWCHKDFQHWVDCQAAKLWRNVKFCASSSTSPNWGHDIKTAEKTRLRWRDIWCKWTSFYYLEVAVQRRLPFSEGKTTAEDRLSKAKPSLGILPGGHYKFRFNVSRIHEGCWIAFSLKQCGSILLILCTSSLQTVFFFFWFAAFASAVLLFHYYGAINGKGD